MVHKWMLPAEKLPFAVTYCVIILPKTDSMYNGLRHVFETLTPKMKTGDVETVNPLYLLTLQCEKIYFTTQIIKNSGFIDT